MSSFNTLIVEVSCPDCGEKHEAQIQFKFGNTWQFQYHIGDPIKWGGNDIGNSDLKEVKVYGIIESTICPFCNNSNIAEEYDIFIKENVIISVSQIESTKDYLNGNGEYVSLE
ncbi:hypothetical protein [Chitinophaga nivalis]|uniref:Uncharacterized protein n=1 Tax=Chitinophaga nivalis TaxID=2991709 RepID=A0ABT3IKJ8_9BACT|nr:hypothetical protein [Chitinophaga nivalis]MCW3465824.1 hypothetical protein [Chitinophaga nivalis]MCW3484485.1 hypothetical protein [Chitinophaga nivalis]